VKDKGCCDISKCPFLLWRSFIEQLGCLSGSGREIWFEIHLAKSVPLLRGNESSKIRSDNPLANSVLQEPSSQRIQGTVLSAREQGDKLVGFGRGGHRTKPRMNRGDDSVVDAGSFFSPMISPQISGVVWD